MSKNGPATTASRDARQTVTDAWDIAVQAAKDGAAKARAMPKTLSCHRPFRVEDGLYDVVFTFVRLRFSGRLHRKIDADGRCRFTAGWTPARAANDWVDDLKSRKPNYRRPPSAAGRGVRIYDDQEEGLALDGCSA